MSRWTHLVCEGCYEGLEPGREPVRVRDDASGACCCCGEKTTSGIYYRGDPEVFLCEGEHSER